MAYPDIPLLDIHDEFDLEAFDRDLGQNAPAAATLQATRPTDPFLALLFDQLEEDGWSYTQVSETEYLTSGRSMGCAYGEVTITANVDERSCSFVLRTGIMVPQDRRRDVARFLRRKNGQLIVAGLTLTEEGEVVFIPNLPCYIEEGDSVAVAVGRAASTIRGEAGNIYAILAGADSWELCKKD